MSGKKNYYHCYQLDEQPAKIINTLQQTEICKSVTNVSKMYLKFRFQQFEKLLASLLNDIFKKN